MHTVLFEFEGGIEFSTTGYSILLLFIFKFDHTGSYKVFTGVFRMVFYSGIILFTGCLGIGIIGMTYRIPQ